MSEPTPKELYAIGAICSWFRNALVGEKVIRANATTEQRVIRLPCTQCEPFVHGDTISVVDLERQAFVLPDRTEIDYWFGRCQRCRTIYWC